ncbi:hypothetical protein ILYODFUR_002934 [Ilyodon furcidens]|uniref:Uncharacterized protein n=1 Tax=Ilyodon furcidens TaxID=33524 RepID=A0ABV0T4T9_9TELE
MLPQWASSEHSLVGLMPLSTFAFSEHTHIKALTKTHTRFLRFATSYTSTQKLKLLFPFYAFKSILLNIALKPLFIPSVISLSSCVPFEQILLSYTQLCR